MNRKIRFATIAVVVLFLSFRLYMIFGGSVSSSSQNLIDDAYYYIKIAQNITIYGFPTFDGINPTNGFHPLWQIVLIPFFLFNSHNYLLGYYAIQLLILFIAILNLTLANRNASLKQSELTGFFVVLFLLQYNSTKLMLNGMESGLYLFFLLLLYRPLLSGSVFVPSKDGTFKGRWLVGLLIAAIALTRLDSIFNIAMVLLLLTYVWFAELKQRFRTLPAGFLPLVLPPLLLLGGYLLINQHFFGHLMPISGSIKSQFSVDGFHFGFLKSYPAVTFLGVYAALIILRFLWAVIRGYLKERSAKERLTQYTDFAIAMGYCIQILYTSLFLCWSVWDYYFISGFLLFIPLTQDLLRFVEWLSVKVHIPPLRKVCYVLIAGSLLFSAGWENRHMSQYSEASIMGKIHVVAQWLNKNTPEDAIIAATDCGLLGFWSQRRTINLDGLVNNFQFQDYLKKREFKQYLKDQGVDYFAIFGDTVQALLNGTYDEYQYSLWAQMHSCYAGTITLPRTTEIWRSKPDPRHMHSILRTIIWTLPWCDQYPLKTPTPNRVEANGYSP